LNLNDAFLSKQLLTQGSHEYHPKLGYFVGHWFTVEINKK